MQSISIGTKMSQEMALIERKVHLFFPQAQPVFACRH